jgi:hypothetical protein
MPFERFETDVPASDSETAMDAIISELEARGMVGANTEPEICMIMRNNIPGEDGFRNVTAIVYVGATLEEIAEDLKTRQ